MIPTTLSQINCQKQGILALLDGIKHCFEQGQRGINVFLQAKTGLGKSSIARCLANDLGGDELTIQQVGARSIDLEMIRRWGESIHQDSMFGRRIIIIDEAQYLTRDQMGLLLTVLDKNTYCGKVVIIFTSMFDDESITGARANEWKPLKDRCIVPPLGNVESPGFQEEIIEHVTKIAKAVGLTIDATAVCKECGFSLRAVYAHLCMESHLSGVMVDEKVFLGNDPEIAERLKLTLDAVGKARAVEFIEQRQAKKPKKTARQKQYLKNLGERGVTLLDMVAKIIVEAGRPMMPIEIAKVFEKNYPEMIFVSGNPRCSINGNVSKDIERRGTGSRFVKVGRKVALNN